MKPTAKDAAATSLILSGIYLSCIMRTLLAYYQQGRVATWFKIQFENYHISINRLLTAAAHSTFHVSLRQPQSTSSFFYVSFILPFGCFEGRA
jgi:hypothetical protein